MNAGTPAEPSAKLRTIVEIERDISSLIALPAPVLAIVEGAASICEAAENLIADIRARHPGEEFHCGHIKALDAALAEVRAL